MIPSQLQCLYLHGFKSGPASAKAQQTLAYFQAHGAGEQIHIPQLPHEPEQACALAADLYTKLIAKVGEENCLLIGSSLGGFYATYLQNRFGGFAALINPAVRPYELLHDYLGENTNYYSDETFMVTEDYLHQLKAMDVTTLRQPERFLLLTQTHDETLDYHQAVQKYLKSLCIIEYGGDHSYQNFEHRIPTILHFAQQSLGQTCNLEHKNGL